MFMFRDRRFGMDHVVFTSVGPQMDGYKGEVEDGVTLDYDMLRIHEWPHGSPRPEPQLGRDPNNSKYYKVFKYPRDREIAGFELVHPDPPFVAPSWSEYNRLYDPTEFSKTTTEDEWYEYMESVDTGTRLRRNQVEILEPKTGSTHEQIAEWVARRHMAADGSIRQVWYLAVGSPKDEIRLLEVSDRFASESVPIVPVDFGLDVSGTKFKLLVADVTVAMIEKIKANPQILPKGWSIENCRIWGLKK